MFLFLEYLMLKKIQPNAKKQFTFKAIQSLKDFTKNESIYTYFMVVKPENTDIYNDMLRLYQLTQKKSKNDSQKDVQERLIISYKSLIKNWLGERFHFVSVLLDNNSNVLMVIQYKK